jgi:hypothetical protein
MNWAQLLLKGTAQWKFDILLNGQLLDGSATYQFDSMLEK